MHDVRAGAAARVAAVEKREGIAPEIRIADTIFHSSLRW